jgi:predicted nuclease of predicted toxin-antitoxin system
MKFRVDAQLPSMLAEWLSKEYGVDALPAIHD